MRGLRRRVPACLPMPALTQTAAASGAAEMNHADETMTVGSMSLAISHVAVEMGWEPMVKVWLCSLPRGRTSLLR